MTLTTYTDTTGGFVNGTTPLNATNMNAIRSFLIATGAMWDSNASWDGNGIQTLLGLKVNPTGTTINGGTSGSATLYQPFQGTFKLVVVNCSGMRTAASNQDIAIPTPFTSTAIVLTGNLGNSQALNLLSSGSAQNVAIVTTWSASGGSGSAQANFFGNTYASINHAFDTVRFISGAAGGATGLVFIAGV